MEFEEMQVIWNSQEDEKMYVIDEPALFAYIKGKGQAINRKVVLLEGIMMVANLLAGAVLLVDAARDGDQPFQYVIAAIYLGYAVFALVRRMLRRQEVAHFEPTMLGELDKAIWQADYLIRQARMMIIWYLVPLLLVVGVMFVFEGKLWWAAAMLILLLPATYLGSRWEIDRFYLPKKRSLEGLREKLTSPQP